MHNELLKKMFEIHPELGKIESMAQNAAQVAYHSFEWQYTTLILFNASYIYGLHVFVKTYDKNIKLYNITESLPSVISDENVNQFILFVTDVAHIQAVLKIIGIQTLHAKAKFIIICKESDDCDETQAVKILWTYRIVNVIFIKNEDSITSGYTYFQDERCDQPTPRRLEYWDKCIDSSKTVIRPCKKYMFPLKFRNFHRCPLVVSTFEQKPYMYIEDGVPYGADGDLLRSIVHALNATLVLISPHDGNGWGSYENNTWTGSLGDVYNGLANVSMTSASITFNRFKHFDMSMSYNTMDLVWVTHPSQYEFSSLKLLNPFTRNGRLLFVVTLIIPLVIHIAMKLRIMKKLKTRFNTGISSDYFLIYALQISLGFAVSKYPKNFYKHVFLFWVWYWFLIRTLYQVYLIHSLHTDVRLNNINTLRDAVEKGYQYGSSSAVREYYLENRFLYDNWVVVDSHEVLPVLKDLAKGKKFLLAINLVFAKMFRKNTHLPIHFLPQKILRSPTVLFFKKKSCLTRDINIVLTRLFEAGIPDTIFDNYTYTPKRKNTQELLIFKHFQGCFAILIFGYILSTFVFIVERLFGTNFKIFRNLCR